MRLLLIFQMALLPLLGHCETFFKDGTKWEVSYTSTSTEHINPSISTFSLEGATTVDGVRALQLFETSDNSTSTGTLISYIREEQGKVWFWHDYTKQWLLLYDFNLKEGESSQVYRFFDMKYQYNPSAYKFKCVKTETINGFEYMHLEQYLPDSDINGCIDEGTWIKGLGSVDGIVNNVFGLDGGASKLLEVSYKGASIYKANTTGIEVTKTSATNVTVVNGVLKITGIDAPTILSIYSLEGKLIARQTVSGDHISYSLPGKGTYLLTIGNHTQKLFIP